MAGGGGCILPGSTHARTDNNVSYPEAKLGNRALPPIQKSKPRRGDTKLGESGACADL